MVVRKTKKEGVLLFLICVVILNIHLMSSSERTWRWSTNIAKDLNFMSDNNDPIKNAISSATGSIFENRRMRTFPQDKRNAYNNHHKRIQSYPAIQPLAKQCKRWAVVTTIFDPTEAMTRIVDMTSWCLVIVPDTKTPRDYMEKLNNMIRDNQNKESNTNKPQINTSSSSDNSSNNQVFYFSIEEQNKWEQIEGPFGSFVRSTPWKHFCRKNIGYLFAILHGAEYMFDFDDDNFVKLDEATGKPMDILPNNDNSEDRNDNDSNEKMTNMMLKNVSVVMQGSKAFNHHPIMGASIDQSWARGFPLHLIQNNHTQGQVAYTQDMPLMSSGGHQNEIGVIQFLADGNPDIDALHRLSKPLPMSFPMKDTHGAPSKSVLVPTHAYAPYNAQATIHTRNAMWATLLPGTVPGRVSDIWRSYFAQCIFADAGLRLVFAPPKIVQERNEHDYMGDFNAEQDLYEKSGKLIDFLSEWDSDEDTVPGRMEHLWIDMYELGYIEVEDVYAVQAWLGALDQAGYDFPLLKRRHRNVAVMGQFNYANRSSTVDDVIFWTQKNRELFHTVLAAGPFSEDQMQALGDNSIDAISNHNDTVGGDAFVEAGFYTPFENLMNTLLRFKNSEQIEGVIYAHDDGIVNMTELSGGAYPFPTHDIVFTGHPKLYQHQNVRTMKHKKKANKMSYRIYPDGHLEDFLKTSTYGTIKELYDGVPLHNWDNTFQKYCGIGQTELAKDPDSAVYREEDGSILFSPFSQADFMFVPTKYADEFARATDLHLKHGIWIECASSTVIDMVRRRADASVRSIRLCTGWSDIRNTVNMIGSCATDKNLKYGFAHPFKLGAHGYKNFSLAYESMQ